MVLLDPVSEGQLNGRLMNAARSNEPITRTCSVCFLSKNHSVTFTMIRTPSSYGRARGLMDINMMMRIETRSTTGVFVVQDNKTINNSNVSMRLFGSTGEPDGRGDRIWDGGLVVSL